MNAEAAGDGILHSVQLKKCWKDLMGLKLTLVYRFVGRELLSSMLLPSLLK